jgi:hypothetical protein
MAKSEKTVLVSFNVQLRSKQIVLWTILPVDRVNTIVLFVCQNSRIELVCVMFLNHWKIKTKYKNPSHVGLEIKTKFFFRWPNVCIFYSKFKEKDRSYQKK